MEPISIIAIIGMLFIGSNVQDNRDDIYELQIEQERIEQQVGEISDRVDRLAISHASVAARDLVRGDRQEEETNLLQQQLNTLNNKLQALGKQIDRAVSIEVLKP